MLQGLPRTIEVAVIGGGPAGAAAALTLARSGVAVVLLDAGHKRLATGETLPPSVRPVLDRLGVRATVATQGHLASVGNWSAWGGADAWGRDFIFNRFGHGWHLDRHRFNALLWDTACDAGALSAHVTVAGSEDLPGAGFRLHLSGGGEISARIVLDASGRAASFARQRGVKRRPIDRMIGLVGYVARRTDRDAEPAATLIEAVPEGWWYSAPLPQDRLVIVFMTDADIARGMGISMQAWLDQLAGTDLTAARALRYGAGLVESPVVVPAACGRLERFGDRNWLALGDAAASQDPLSSEGILVAMQSGIEGAVAAMRALDGDRDALSGAAARREAAWERFLEQRDIHYGMERRWCKAPFWQRRHTTEQGIGEQRSVA